MRGQSLNVQLFGAWFKICNDEIRMSPRGPLPSGQCTSSWYNIIDSNCRNESAPTYQNYSTGLDPGFLDRWGCRIRSTNTGP